MDEMIPKAAIGAVANEFRHFHRNACYPDATDIEAELAATTALTAAALYMQQSDAFMKATDAHHTGYLDGIEAAAQEAERYDPSRRDIIAAIRNLKVTK